MHGTVQHDQVSAMLVVDSSNLDMEGPSTLTAQHLTSAERFAHSSGRHHCIPADEVLQSIDPEARIRRHLHLHTPLGMNGVLRRVGGKCDPTPPHSMGAEVGQQQGSCQSASMLASVACAWQCIGMFVA